MKPLKSYLTAIFVSTLFITTAHAKPSKLPFIGTKTFNFAGGIGTQESIKISKDGTTTITIHGTQSSEVIYKGKYQTFIPVYEGSYYRINGKSIEKLDSNKRITRDCLDGDGNETACRVLLY